MNSYESALELPELGKEHPELTKGENYYDILIRFVFLELEKILQRGLYTGYKNYEDNLTCVRGKILFKEHLIVNHNINDKMYCSFSEVSSDIIENRIIKYTLYYLSHCYFQEDTIDAQIIRYYKRLDEVDLVSITSDYFKSIEYTPLNQHYRPILTLCELLLRDSALDEEIGEKTSISFLINMNKLFEEFVGNLLEKRLYEYQVELQKIAYPEKSGKGLIVKIDIMISRGGIPLFFIDTKNQEISETPKASHLQQVTFYSNTTYIKNCALVYVGKSQTRCIPLKEDITTHFVSFDMAAENDDEFKIKCDEFINEIRKILDSLVNKN